MLRTVLPTGLMEHQIRQVEERAVRAFGADIAHQRRRPAGEQEAEDPTADGRRNRRCRLAAEAPCRLAGRFWRSLRRGIRSPPATLEGAPGGCLPLRAC